MVCASAMFSVAAFAGDKETLGAPTDKAIDFQRGASSLKYEAISFHNHILLPIIVAIVVFVAILLAICVVRFNKKSNPIPAKFSHNTPIEIAWTIIPVLILMFISIFSFRLLFAYHNIPKPDLTVKAVGYQWYWGYEYPDQKIGEFTSTLVKEDKLSDDQRAKGLYLLAASDPMVVPVGKVVRVQVTGADVIHAFAMPAFGLKTDAVPGRLNETWFRADQIGDYYGQCSELCGVDHSAMPIWIKVVSQADFDAWVASKGPKTAPAAATTPVSTTPAPAGAAPAAPAPAAAPGATN
ncbi:MAG: cytochrome c oxidase subunit 2 [Caulobacter sp.]|nr:cytochrome c oxidase subunit 2 [Caulobacter sp.]